MTRTISNHEPMVGHGMGTTQGSDFVDLDNLQSGRSEGPTVHGVNTERIHSRYVRSSSHARARAKSGAISPRAQEVGLGSPSSPGLRQVFSQSPQEVVEPPPPPVVLLQKKPSVIDGSRLRDIPLAKIEREVRGERKRKAANAKLSELRRRSGRNDDGRVADGVYLVDKPADFA